MIEAREIFIIDPVSKQKHTAAALVHGRLLASLREPDQLNITDAAGQPVRFGCDQGWFAAPFQRQAGCGPCTAANLLFYLARQEPRLAEFPGGHPGDDQAFLPFMHELWTHVRPGLMGIYRSSLLTRGIARYAASQGLAVQTHALAVPVSRWRRPRLADWLAFIKTGLAANSPVAFLNRSNGSLANLEHWHWVTIASLYEKDDGDVFAVISDSGYAKSINLSAWYRTTRLGGGAVYLTVQPAAPAEAQG